MQNLVASLVHIPVIRDDKKKKNCHPNATIFERMGPIDDEASPLFKSPFILIRHAISTSNIVSERVKNEVLLELPGNTAEIKQKRREMEMEQMGDWEKNHELIDSFIEEHKGNR